MAIPTLKDLYQNAGNPDLSHWSIHSVYTLFEAALLSAGIDPFSYDVYDEDDRVLMIKKNKPINWQWAISILRALTQSVCLGDLTAKDICIWKFSYDDGKYLTNVKQEDLTVGSMDELCPFRTIITRLSLIAWCKEKELTPKPMQFKQLNTTVKQARQAIEQNITKSLPAPQYTTPAMECLDEVVKQFWSTFDPDDSDMRPPAKSEIMSWLENNGHKYGITSANMREAIDIIARHPKAKAGGNKAGLTPKKQ